MQIISERHKVTDIYYDLNFYNNGELCLGFPCDESGNVRFDKMQPAAIENYNGAISKGLKHKVQRYSNTYTEPAVGKCECCGREVQLVNDYCGATECECGQWYNLSGQSLNPPKMWEEPIDYDY